MNETLNLFSIELEQDQTLEPIYAAQEWQSNAELIYDLHRLGYMNENDYTLDPTFGRGNWWTIWRPNRLVTSDKKTGTDFRNLPHDDETFDVIAYDPPYVSTGSTKHAGTADIRDRYGLADAPQNPKELQQLINDGATECTRVLKTGGTMFIKCQDYIKSGKYFAGTHYTIIHAQSLGLILEDRLEHISGPRPQPKGRRQVHARRNLSTLLVFKKGKQ